MEQTIKINVPEGKKAIYDKKSQTIKFVDIEPVRSKSWDEFCKNNPKIENEWFIDSNSSVNDYSFYTGKRSECKNESKNLLATKEDAEGILALMQLTRLHDEWIEDCKQSESSVYPKPTICISANGDAYIEYVNRHSLLQFPTDGMAEDFLKYFKNLIYKAKKFI